MSNSSKVPMLSRETKKAIGDTTTATSLFGTSKRSIRKGSQISRYVRMDLRTYKKFLPKLFGSRSQRGPRTPYIQSHLCTQPRIKIWNLKSPWRASAWKSQGWMSQLRSTMDHQNHQSKEHYSRLKDLKRSNSRWKSTTLKKCTPDKLGNMADRLTRKWLKSKKVILLILKATKWMNGQRKWEKTTRPGSFRCRRCLKDNYRSSYTRRISNTKKLSGTWLKLKRKDFP